MARYQRRTCRGSARRTETAVSQAQAVLRLGRAAHMAACPLDCRLDDPSEPLAVVLIILETVGGLCVALGLFTRFFAAAITIEMAVIVYHHVGKGFGWGGGGYEYPLMWGLLMFAVALRGGGPWSLDRKLGWQL